MRFLDRAFGAVVVALALLNSASLGQGLPNGGQPMAPVGQAWQGSSSLAPNGTVYDLVRDFGAKCDGSTDDTQAIKNWLAKLAANVRLTAPAGICLFSAPLQAPHANYYGVEGAGLESTIFLYTGGATSATATAGASFTAAATSITLSATAPTWLTSALASGYAVTAWDTTYAPPRLIGKVSSASGTTATIAGSGAVYASSGSSDALLFSVDLLTFNDLAHGGEMGATFSGFSVQSQNALTGGYALRFNGLFDSALTNVSADSANSSQTWAGNLCGGFWFNGVGGVQFHNPVAASFQSSCADGLLVNSALGGTAELKLIGGDLGGKVSGGVAVGFLDGIHVAGGIGGVRCESTNIHNNSGNGALIDNAVAATANREFDQGAGCAFDGNETSGITVNDTLASGGTVDLAGWTASTRAGDGIVISSWANGDVEIRGDKVYNHCGSGIYVADITTHVNVSPGTSINGNGATGGSDCTTWKSGHAGHGYGIQATSNTANIAGSAAPWNNSAGNYSPQIVGSWNRMAGGAAMQALMFNGGSPSRTGTCAMTSVSGGNTSGKLSVTSACSSQTITLTFATTASNGWMCPRFADITTPADTWAETSSTTTSITMTGSAAASDVIEFMCTAY